FQCTEFFGRHFFADWIFASIKSSANDESRNRRRVPNQAHYGFVRAKRTTAPVHRDEREKPVLDLVSLARVWWEVTDVDREVELIGELLKLGFPHVRSIAVRAARVGSDKKFARIRVALRAQECPPRFNRCDRKDGSVVVGS